MNFLINGYDYNGLDKVEIEYTPSGQSSWTILGSAVEKTGQNPELADNPLGSEVTRSVLNLTDGLYDIRLKVVCGINISYSERIRNILLDRAAPEVLGIPEPKDDNFVSGDEISVQFNELLLANEITPVDIQLRRIFTGEIFTVQIQTFENKVTITPNVSLTPFDAESFELSLSNVKDLYENAIPEPVVWKFTVGGDLTSLDFDGDGVPNPIDRCPGANNSIDADNDGVPDFCDLCSDLPNPGVHFAGANDQLLATGRSTLGTGNTVHTLESWIYLDELPSTNPTHLLLLGQDGNGAHQWLT